MNITATDAQKRTISGRVVTWGEQGNTSAGATKFKPDSLTFNKTTKLLLEHDRTRPIGKLLSYEIDNIGIQATFRVANTMAGEDALVEASDGLRDGFSVGVAVDAWSNDNGVMLIEAARVQEISLVTDPAIDSARVDKVAASENEVSETPVSEESNVTEEVTETEGDDLVSDTAKEAAAPEAVEAAKETVTVSASAPAYTSPRSPINSMASYLEHSVKAKRGNEDSVQYVAHFNAEKAKFDAKALTAADSTGNPGLVYPETMRELVTNSIGTTAAIDAVGTSALVETGLSFYIPYATQYPTVATTAEGDAASDTDMETDRMEVAIVKKAGKQKVSFELFDRSTPSFWLEVQRQLQIALAKNKDAYLLTELANGTAAATTAGTIAGLQSFIATETTAALAGTGDFASKLLTSPDWWTTIKAAKDTTGRGLYNAINPMNANGSVNPQSLRGEVEGMSLYVDPFLAAGSGLVDGSAFIIGDNAARYWESPVKQVQVNNLSDGSIEIEYYQYVAAKVVKPLGVRKFNLT